MIIERFQGVKGFQLLFLKISQKKVKISQFAIQLNIAFH